MTDIERTLLTADLTLFGETRTVEFFRYTDLSDTAQVHNQLVARQDGYSAKAIYVEPLMLWRVTEAKPVHRGNKTITASDGSVWQFHLHTNIRNRSAHFIGWKDVVAPTNFESNERRSEAK